jgi:hypothetical protein
MGSMGEHAMWPVCKSMLIFAGGAVEMTRNFHPFIHSGVTKLENSRDPRQ